MSACDPLREAAPADGYTVDYVIDGDTIDVAGPDGSTERVRLLGINTPELAHDGHAAQCGGEEAADRLAELLPEGTPVQLVSDSRADDEDRYGRLLRYIETDAGDAGATLISEGYAYAWTPACAPTSGRLGSYGDATTTARETNTGSWATCPGFEGSR
ncbi:thermonuclease family protein [Brachybacterium paraconglomeratum]|uniref:thermonuclease family protein n=1 Tax=Brachybacterium paraconglomeratum TaxID=173362 RepID=UPI0022E73C4D|nr:thermonuclease family protein [Brachybacterium paraconglomeratum]